MRYPVRWACHQKLNDDGSLTLRPNPPPAGLGCDGSTRVLRLQRKLKSAHRLLLFHPPACGTQGVMAMTRKGLPEPPTIFRGAAMTMAPVGGSWSRLHRLANPNLPLPCIR